MRIAGRCAVFAESDMIHKQQLGYNTCDIIGGLYDALVRNYLSNVAKGRKSCQRLFFKEVLRETEESTGLFETALQMPITIPQHHEVMGAIGAAILAREKIQQEDRTTKFQGFSVSTSAFQSKSFICNGCTNQCEVVSVMENQKAVGFFGDRCEKWRNKVSARALN